MALGANFLLQLLVEIVAVAGHALIVARSFQRYRTGFVGDMTETAV
jgi:hypothetical protein